MGIPFYKGLGGTRPTCVPVPMSGEKEKWGKPSGMSDFNPGTLLKATAKLTRQSKRMLVGGVVFVVGLGVFFVGGGGGFWFTWGSSFFKREGDGGRVSGLTRNGEGKKSGLVKRKPQKTLI